MALKAQKQGQAAKQEPALRRPASVRPAWLERVERAKKAHEVGEQLRGSRPLAPSLSRHTK